MSKEVANPLSATPPPPACEPLNMADAPFNKPAADVIIRSSDGIDFYVFKGILAEASPFFEGMFTLPQATGQHVEDEYIDGRPIIRLAEPSKTLRTLLLFCYPVREPTVGTDAEICAVLAAARKYDMEHVATKVRALFLAGVEGNPFRIYALALARDWRDEMRIAAKATLLRPLLLALPATCPPGLEDISLSEFYKLRNYQQRCVDAATNLLTFGRHTTRFSIDWLPARIAPAQDWVWFRCRHRNVVQTADPPPQNVGLFGGPTNPPPPNGGLFGAAGNPPVPNGGLFGAAANPPQANPVLAPAANPAPVNPAPANPAPINPPPANLGGLGLFGQGGFYAPPARIVLNGVSKEASRWWVRGVVSISDALKKSPRGATVLRDDLTDAIISQAANTCPGCLNTALSDIREFREQYALLVEEAISGIDLEF